MGISYFFSWYKRNFRNKIYNIKYSISESVCETSMDNLMIDMNGLIHNSAQKVYKYGNYKQPYTLIIKETNKKQIELFNEICNSIENILVTVNPNKRLILCIDGVAPVGKQCQQRSRRYKSSLERKEDDCTFDSTKITPGTEFFHHLSKYIDWFIRKRVSENHLWKNIEVIFSNEKAEKEGEHKCMLYIRKFGKSNESFIIHALDADLIMLALSTHLEKIYILRDDLYNSNNNFLLLDIGGVRKDLINILKWEPYIEDEEREESIHRFNEEWIINDFVFLCFLVGNDFLPHIETLEIIEGGIDIIINICKNVGRTHGHITRITNGKILFSKYSLCKFFEIISQMEQSLFEKKFKNRANYFEDKLLTSCSYYDTEINEYKIDIDKYRIEYYKKYFPDTDINIVCNEYLKGLQWVLTYYYSDVPSWKWFYPYFHAPLATSLYTYINHFENPRFYRGKPFTPFEQLLCILPQKSSYLLPIPLNTLLTEKMKSFYPDNVEIDLSGKKNDWQGIVKLPFLDYSFVKKIYDSNVKFVNEKELRRNIFNKTLIYNFDDSVNFRYNSYYGNFICKVKIKLIDL